MESELVVISRRKRETAKDVFRGSAAYRSSNCRALIAEKICVHVGLEGLRVARQPASVGLGREERSRLPLGRGLVDWT